MSMLFVWLNKWMDVMEPMIYLFGVAVFILIIRRSKGSGGQEGRIRDLEERVRNLEKDRTRY